MRVLLIDVNCKSSSTGKIVYNLYKKLNKQNHTAAICYGRGSVINEKNILKFSTNIETYAHALLTRITGITGIFSPFSTLKLIRYIKKFKPDVIHIHELHAYFVNYGAVIKYIKKNNIKTIWTFHCEFMYTGKCGYAYECNKWKSSCGKCPQLKEYPKSMIFDFTKMMQKHKIKLFKDFNNLIIVSPSLWLANRIKQSFLKNKDIRVINNSIDESNIFYPRKFDHLKKKHNIKNEKILLAVAPDIMSERKGGKWIIQIAKKIENTNIKVIMIGVSDLTQTFNNNIIAMGRTNNQEELAEYYSMADIFIICSKMENFPTTCLESIACGTPVVGFDTGGTKETVPREMGDFTKYGDIDALTTNINRIIDKKK